MGDLVDDRLRAALDAHPAVRAARPGLEAAVRDGRLPPTAAARALVAAFLGEEGGAEGPGTGSPRGRSRILRPSSASPRVPLPPRPPHRAGVADARSLMQREARLVWLLPLCGLLAIRPLVDPDLWWHLENGRQMVAQGTLTPLDARAFTAAPAVRVDPSWLWDLLSYGLGETPTRLVPALVMGLSLGLGLRLVPAAGRVAAALGGLLLVPVLLARAHPRPDVLVPLLLVLLVGLLRQPAPGRRHLAAAGLLAAVWVQLHASFLLIPAAVIPALLGRRGLRTGLAALLGAAAGVLLHPAGPGPLLGTVLGQLQRDPAAIDIIEWQGLDLGALVGWPGPELCLLLLGAVALGAARRAPPWPDLALAGLLLVATLRADRTMAAAGTAAWLALGAAPLPRLRGRLVPMALPLLALVVLRSPAALPGLEVPDLERPDAVRRVLAGVPAGGRVLNWFDLGGVITWDHGPAWSVAIDPRAELGFDPDTQAAVSAAFQGGEAWQRLQARFDVDAVVTPRPAPLCRALQEDPDWVAMSGDGHWAVFRHRRGEIVPPPARLDPCLDEVAFLAACRQDRDLLPLALRDAEDFPDAFVARRAGMAALSCGGDGPTALAWLDEAVRRDSRDRRSRQALGLPGGVDAWWLGWFRGQAAPAAPPRR